MMLPAACFLSGFCSAKTRLIPFYKSLDVPLWYPTTLICALVERTPWGALPVWFSAFLIGSWSISTRKKWSHRICISGLWVVGFLAAIALFPAATMCRLGIGGR